MLVVSEGPHTNGVCGSCKGMGDIDPTTIAIVALFLLIAVPHLIMKPGR